MMLSGRLLASAQSLMADRIKETDFMKHPFKDWLIAVRPWSFPASAMPVIASIAYAYAHYQTPNWLNGIWALLNIIIFHAAGNTWSDYFDYKRKVDAEDTFGVKTLTSGQFQPKEIYFLSWGLLAVALMAGIGLWLRTGMPLLYIGVGGLACSLLYPYLKYHALGDLVIFIAYGLLPTLGTVYAMTLHLDPEVLYIALPIGLITVAILHCNNTRDIQTDQRARIRTIAMNIGPKASVRLYCFEVLFPFAWMTGCIIAGILPVWCLLVWIAFFPALQNTRKAIRYFKEGSGAIADLDQGTAQLQLAFSLLLALSFVLARLIG